MLIHLLWHKCATQQAVLFALKPGSKITYSIVVAYTIYSQGCNSKFSMLLIVC